MHSAKCGQCICEIELIRIWKMIFANKAAIVTGGYGGIGLGTARSLLSKGIDVQYCWNKNEFH